MPDFLQSTVFGAYFIKCFGIFLAAKEEKNNFVEINVNYHLAYFGKILLLVDIFTGDW